MCLFLSGEMFSLDWLDRKSSLEKFRSVDFVQQFVCIVSRSSLFGSVPECCAKLECFVNGLIRVVALFGLFPKFLRFLCFSDIGNVA